MKRLANGELSALGELYDRYAADVRGFAMRATGQRSAADDITQDTFIALTDAAPRFDSDRNARAFIIGIAAKLVLRRRRRVATALRILTDVFRWSHPAEPRTPEEEAATEEALQRYQDALKRLSPEKRIAVLMADVEGMSGPEIAEALSIPIGTVWTRLHHSRAALRRALTKESAR